MIMRSLKPEFLNALDNFIAARSHADKMENWFLRRRIVVELEWQANSNYCDAGQLVLFPDPDKPAVFTSGYRHEVEIGGELYTIIAKLDDYTGTRWSSSRDTDGFPEN